MSAFGKAFAAARKSGLKEFEWNGKSFNTRTADEDATKKPAALPKSAGREVNPGEFVGAPKASAKKSFLGSFGGPKASAAPAAKPTPAEATPAKPSGGSFIRAGLEKVAATQAKKDADKKAAKRNLGQRMFEMGQQRVKSGNYAKGGSVRGAGCAKRGHGKGRMV